LIDKSDIFKSATHEEAVLFPEPKNKHQIVYKDIGHFTDI